MIVNHYINIVRYLMKGGDIYEKKLLALVLTVAAVSVVPISAYANSETSEKTITNQKIVQEVSENGAISEYGLVTYENQTAEMAKAGCSTGHHGNLVNNGTPDTTRIHGPSHPGYCTVKTTTYWRCTLCNTTGQDNKYTLVWCTSPNIYGDEGETDQPGLASN